MKERKTRIIRLLAELKKNTSFYEHNANVIVVLEEELLALFDLLEDREVNDG